MPFSVPQTSPPDSGRPRKRPRRQSSPLVATEPRPRSRQPRDKVPGAASPNAAVSTPSRLKSGPPFSLKTLGLVGERLSPTDFVAMVSVCPQWRALKDVPSVTRQVAANGRLCPPPLSDLSGPTMVASSDPWADILFESRLLRRLQRGPIEIGARETCPLVRLSPNGQHVLLDRYDERIAVRHLDGYGRRRTGFPTHRLEHFLEFAAHGNALVGSVSCHGPVKLFDLTKHARPPRTIAPRADYRYQSMAACPSGNFWIFSCSDGHLRTYTADPEGIFRQSSDFPLGRTMNLQAISENGKVLIALHDDQSTDCYHVYYSRSKSAWEKVRKIDKPLCCAQVTVSPLGRFVLTDGCADSGFYALDPDAPAPPHPFRTALWFEGGILAPDESKVAVRTAQGYATYRWPDLKEIGDYPNDCHEDLRWLRPYSDWKSQSLKVAVESDNGVWRIKLKPSFS